MSILYNCIVIITTFFLSIVALFNKKIKLFVAGRAATFEKLSVFNADDKIVWFHAASLGEFEQGRPIIERLKQEFPLHKILLTFFSPSGYEVRKDYQLADVVCYLPMDSKKNVKQFLDAVNPTMAVFIKYEFWPNYLKGLQQRNIPTILVSGIFRKKQIFFTAFGGFMRKSLNAFDHFFVQDKISKDLLNSINQEHVTISGDTRFDRVYEILQQDNALDYISEFKNKQYTVVAGSTWKEDEELLVNYINNSTSKEEKFIIAPHNMNANAIFSLKKAISKKTVLYSEKGGKVLSEFEVFIVDTIGILTKIYSIADAAYVGGGLTKNGVHNILEPATFGVPIVIGPQYKKYKEVVDLVALNGCKVIANQNEFSAIFTRLKENENYRKQLGQINTDFIKENIGATKATMKYINSQLK
ncbi:MAG: 3-deoxy-D-manno-octulosonic acid transferase [Flavobacteriaceae bacterium]|nr:3-deoxy-D-manno-octulosonic acid transferase [Flavobacteriaceae bacterium]